MTMTTPGAGTATNTLRIAVDIGGTFTDVAAFDESTSQLLLGKWSSTPRDLVEGILRAIAESGGDLARANVVLHGSTVVINAILERKGAPTALVTTRGFRDVYEIGRINRPESFNLFFRKHVPLVPRELVYEVPERMLPDGTEDAPLDEPALRAIAADLRRHDVEAVAVVFLHSYLWPEHEQEA